MAFDFERDEIPKFPGLLRAIGPGIVWLALAQGSGELIWWPYFIAKYGTAVLPLLLPSAIAQIPLTYHIGKYSMITGESIWRGLARLSKKLTILLWILMNVSFFWFGSFVVAGGTAISELIPLGISRELGSKLWGYVLIALMFITLLRSRRTYGVIEKFMWFVAVGTFLGLMVSCLHPDVMDDLGRFAQGFLQLNLKVIERDDYEELITAITFMGLGGFWSLFYSYWVLDKELGMSSKTGGVGAGRIPSEGSRREDIRKWKMAVLVDTSTGVFGNIVTTLMTCLLAFSILHPTGTYPSGYKIAVVQSEFFRGWFGEAGVKMFLFASALFLVDTWMATADAVAKTNADIVRIFWPEKNHEKLYRSFLLVITIITTITLPIAPPGELMVISAMIGFVGMVVFSFAILILHLKLNSVLPKVAKTGMSSLLAFFVTAVLYLLLFIAYVWSKATT